MKNDDCFFCILDAPIITDVESYIDDNGDLIITSYTPTAPKYYGPKMIINGEIFDLDSLCEKVS